MRRGMEIPGNTLESPYLVINNLMRKRKNKLPMFFLEQFAVNNLLRK
jgi:hypothetical protein